MLLYRPLVCFVHALQSATTMSWFMLGMAAHPEVQQKCQEELDRVIGRSRMPTLEDRDNLPYICATLREALRWRPVLPLGESLPTMNLTVDPHLRMILQEYTIIPRRQVSPTSRKITNIPLFQDDWYEGFFIPKGTICLANIWYDPNSHFVPQES